MSGTPRVYMNWLHIVKNLVLSVEPRAACPSNCCDRNCILSLCFLFFVSDFIVSAVRRCQVDDLVFGPNGDVFFLCSTTSHRRY